VGFDALPDEVRSSPRFDRNALAQLAALPELPDETDVNEHKLIELSDLYMELEDDPAALEQALHARAVEELERGAVREAWMTLLAWNAG
jgi:hypothetical protein